MNLSGLLPLLTSLPAYRSFLDDLLAGEPDRAPLGIYGAARPYLVAALAQAVNRVTVLLVARSEQARQIYDELQVWLPPANGLARVQLLADPDALPYERIPWARETRQARMSALTALLRRQGGIAGLAGASAASESLLIVTSARGLMQKTLPPRELRLALKPLRVGQMFDMNESLMRWLGMGYRTDAVVEEVGLLSRRGGIVDIWPPNMVWPVRIELFGDEIDSLRLFDPATQRTLIEARSVREVLIGPASEALPRYGAGAQDLLDALDVRPLHPPARHELDGQREQLRQGTGFKGQEWYIPYLYSQPASLLDYLPNDALLLLDDGAEFMTLVTELEHQAAQTQRDLITGGDLPANPLPPHFSWTELKAPLEARKPLMLGHGDLEGRPAPATAALARHFVPGPRFGGQVKSIVAEVEKQQDQSNRVVMVSRQAPRLSDVFQEEAGRALTVEETLLDAPAPPRRTPRQRRPQRRLDPPRPRNPD